MLKYKMSSSTANRQFWFVAAFYCLNEVLHHLFSNKTSDFRFVSELKKTESVHKFCC